uniref:30S ribosomal protein S11 n=1 Tax=Nephromyces sp. ex Molgula occidentalis TaxID=2544991 RepID=A0A5C1H804_9APIC|nr:30S ribosomal protein S11 [Nephromyces sp. ex Molgula occidentalis]
MTIIKSFSKNWIKFYISSTKRNIFINLIDVNNNNIIKKFSLGSCGFKGRDKLTSFALMKIAYEASLYCLNLNYTKLSLVIYGRFYLNRYLLLKIILTTTLKNKFLQIISINDITSYPFNGWRSKKQRK